MINLSICMPGIRTDKWIRLYNSAEKVIGQYSFELIMIGPNNPPEELLLKSNFKYIKDFGSPARCMQIGISSCIGELITWGSDDGYFENSGLEKALDLYWDINDEKTEIIMRYKEGRNHSGTGMDDSYWTARTHNSLKLPGVKDHYKIAPVGMLNTNYMKSLGGFDCRFEHLNMCCHDLSFRIQEDWGKLWLSPEYILNCNWNPGEGDNKPVLDAFFANDLPLFQSIYNNENIAETRIQIPLDNWRASPEKWARRFL